METGVYLRHSRRSAGGLEGPCTCTPTYQAMAWSTREKKPLRRSISSLAKARRWRQEAQVALRCRELDASSATTLAEAATRSGTIPSTSAHRLATPTRASCLGASTRAPLGGASASRGQPCESLIGHLIGH